jgi:hypothetical protein
MWYERELKGIGVDIERLGGLAFQSDSLQPEDLMRWMCSIPSGLGHDAFIARLQASPEAGGPRALTRAEWEATGRARELELVLGEPQAFWIEFNRIVASVTFDGFSLPCSYGDAADHA